LKPNPQTIFYIQALPEIRESIPLNNVTPNLLGKWTLDEQMFNIFILRNTHDTYARALLIPFLEYIPSRNPVPYCQPHEHLIILFMEKKISLIS
jgi:hypothetical protein